MEENVFYQTQEESMTVNPFDTVSYEETAARPKPCPPGHYKSIQAGGNGHWVGDSCGCDSITPSVSINAWIPILLLVALIVIIKVYRRTK